MLQKFGGRFCIMSTVLLCAVDFKTMCSGCDMKLNGVQFCCFVLWVNLWHGT